VAEIKSEMDASSEKLQDRGYFLHFYFLPAKELFKNNLMMQDSSVLYYGKH